MSSFADYFKQKEPHLAATMIGGGGDVKPPGKLGLSLCSNNNHSFSSNHDLDDANDGDDYDLNNAAPFFSRKQQQQQLRLPSLKQASSDYDSVHNLKYQSIEPRVLVNQSRRHLNESSVGMMERSRSGSSRDLSSPDSAMILKSLHLRSCEDDEDDEARRSIKSPEFSCTRRKMAAATQSKRGGGHEKTKSIFEKKSLSKVSLTSFNELKMGSFYGKPKTTAIVDISFHNRNEDDYHEVKSGLFQKKKFDDLNLSITSTSSATSATTSTTSSSSSLISTSALTPTSFTAPKNAKKQPPTNKKKVRPQRLMCLLNFVRLFKLIFKTKQKGEKH